jgi:short-subunit dehydrogenase
VRPELFGPIIIAGAPLSYWAGVKGRNPMRYSGGLLGGSWLTALTSDLGAGVFDGAWLVQNFENLNPANTFWTKQYNLYANIDTEAKRYLSFEKWWGGHVFLNAAEIQYIVDNLFIGNRLATAGLVTSDGIRIDLRNIHSPIIVFCSKGDNITPPPQALGWVPDLYQSDEEIQAHGQTIVYAVHESIGHLGIFVSGSVARKEHQEFTSNIDMIDVLPPGIYEAEFTPRTAETPNAESAGDYVMSAETRTLNDVRAIVQRHPEDDRRFATASRISQINLGLYRSFLRPWVRAAVTPMSASWMQHMHPLRLPYELISDRNPLVASVEKLAESVRENRAPAPEGNPFLLAQNMVSNWIEAGLEIYQELRDATLERFGGVDLLFNNAGVMQTGASWELDAAQWRRMLDINLMGVINGLRSFMPLLLEQGRPAHVVNTASLAGLVCSPFMAAYTVTKQAVVALSEVLHYEMAALQAPISVSVLCPGPVASRIMTSDQASGTAAGELGALLAASIEQGMSTDELARRVFQALAAGRFWILPHPGFKPNLLARQQSILEETNPVFQMAEL